MTEPVALPARRRPSVDGCLHPVVRQLVAADVERTFAVVSDPTTYPAWLYGARRIRSVDEGWPAPGSRFHHHVGPVLPVVIADSTEVIEIEPPHRLVLEVRFRPVGVAVVTFELGPAGDDAAPTAGAGPMTEVCMQERPQGRLALFTPLLAGPFALRNVLSLRALDRYLR